MNNDRLTQVFQDSCHKHGVTDEKTIEQITNNGSRLFAINQAGYVEPRGDFTTIAEYVKSFRAREPRQGIPKKEQLYGKIIEMAESGNMVGYRKARAEYSKV